MPPLLLSAGICGCVSIPNWDAACQQALDGGPVEVCEDAGVHTKFSQSPKKKELLTSFLDRGVCSKCPGYVLSDVHAEEPEAADPLNLSIADVDGGGGSTSLMSSVIHDHLLHFADIEREVVCLAPASQRGPSSLSAESSLFVMRPKMVVLSTNLLMVL